MRDHLQRAGGGATLVYPAASNLMLKSYNGSNQERGEAQRTMVMMMAMGSVAVVGSHKVDFA
ncbi:unnamed protein product [Ascophyllum nodosum]